MPDSKNLLGQLRQRRDLHAAGLAAVASAGEPQAESVRGDLERLLLLAEQGAQSAVRSVEEQGIESPVPLRALFRWLDAMARFGPFVLIACLTLVALPACVLFFHYTETLGPELRIPLYVLFVAAYPLLALLLIAHVPVGPRTRRWAAVGFLVVFLALGTVSVVFPAVAVAVAISSQIASDKLVPRARMTFLANSASIRPLLAFGHRVATALELAEPILREKLAPAIRSLAQLCLDSLEEAIDLYHEGRVAALAPTTEAADRAASAVASVEQELDVAREAHQQHRIQGYDPEFDDEPYRRRIARLSERQHEAEEALFQAKEVELAKVAELANRRFPEYRHAVLTNAAVSLLGPEAGTPLDPLAAPGPAIAGFDDESPLPFVSTQAEPLDHSFDAGPWRIVGAVLLGAMTLAATSPQVNVLLAIIVGLLGLLVGPWLRLVSGLAFYAVGVVADVWEGKVTRLILPLLALLVVYLVGSTVWHG